MASRSTDITKEKMMDSIASGNSLAIMGDPLSGKSLLIAKMLSNEKVIPGSDYIPTNGSARYHIETSLGETELIEISGSPDTWTVDLKKMLYGVTMVVVISSHPDGETDTDWKGLVSALYPNLPIFVQTDPSPRFITGLLTAIAAKMYPIRDLYADASVSEKRCYEHLMNMSIKSTAKEIRARQKSIVGVSMILSDEADALLRKR